MEEEVILIGRNQDDVFRKFFSERDISSFNFFEVQFVEFFRMEGVSGEVKAMV